MPASPQERRPTGRPSLLESPVPSREEVATRGDLALLTPGGAPASAGRRPRPSVTSKDPSNGTSRSAPPLKHNPARSSYPSGNTGPVGPGNWGMRSAQRVPSPGTRRSPHSSHLQWAPTYWTGARTPAEANHGGARLSAAKPEQK